MDLPKNLYNKLNKKNITKTVLCWSKDVNEIV